MSPLRRSTASACWMIALLLPATARAAWPAHLLHEHETSPAYVVRAMTEADVDGDGDIDVLSAAGARISWYENLGGGSFTLAHIIDREGARSLEMLDADGDADLDAFACDRWFENLGSGFGPAQPIVGLEDCLWGSRVDLDGDGDRDLVALSDQGELRWYDGVGASLASPVVLASIADLGRADNWSRVVPDVDVDGDGDLDVVAALDDGVAWFEMTDAGMATGAHLVQTTLGYTPRLRAGDLDDDGQSEIAIEVLGAARWYRWVSGQLVEVGPSLPQLPDLLVDLDDDGDLDAVLSGQGSQYAENLGVGFATPVELTPHWGGPTYDWHAHAADLDGDGAIDLYGHTIANSITWMKNLGGGAMEPGQLLDLPYDRFAPLAAADLDGDGAQELVAAVWADGSSIESDFPDHQRARLFDLVGGQVEGLTDLARLAAPAAVTDLDGDGDIDVAVTLDPYDAPGLAWLANDGGRFDGPPTPIPVDIESASSFVFRDVDGDGDLDLVSSQRVDPPGGPPLWELFENREGTFARVATVSGLPASDWTVADGDGDGDLDLFTCELPDGWDGDLASTQLTWHHNDDGLWNQLEARSLGPCGAFGRWFVGDYDRDGEIDAIVVDGSVVRLYLTASTGLETDTLVPADDLTVSRAADLDGDGVNELIFAGLARFAWLDADADGLHLYEETLAGATTEIWPAAVTDIDGDGDLDFTSDQASTEHWYENDLPDADGDGVKDLADCAPGDAAISPVVAEVCDGIDNDCDGAVDEDCPVVTDTSEPTTRDRADPDEGGCGCTASGSAGWLTLWPLLAVVTWRRRLPAGVAHVVGP